MYRVYVFNKISNKGFDLLGKNYEISQQIDGVDAVIVRSGKMHDLVLPRTIKAIVRAGAGINNIPVEECAKLGIVVLNTPGANANAVKELVIAGILLSSRNIVGGINWVSILKEDVSKQVEKGKSVFAGPEIFGKKLGVIGLGAIGVMVANAAHALGMEVIGYDPYISIDAAWGLSCHIRHANTLDDVLLDCDYITIHVPLLETTKDMINEQVLEKVKPGVRILNFSRDTLVNNKAMKEALDCGAVAKYVTDFPVEEIMGHSHIITIPHLGASTPESEENCAVMAVKQLKDYLETGNIVNSVNFPQCEMSWNSDYRLTIIHKNIPAMLGKITAIIADEGINITDMINKSKGDWAYTMIDTDTIITEENRMRIEKINDIIRVRILEKR